MASTDFLQAELIGLSARYGLSPQVAGLLLAAAENEWCPIAALHSSGQLQIMSSWQIFGLFAETCMKYFPVRMLTLADGNGYAFVHESNGNCIIGDSSGRVDAQILSPLEAGFVRVAGRRHQQRFIAEFQVPIE